MENRSKRKTTLLRGIFWSMCEVLANKVSGFIVGVILARLLMPEDFGLIGMITVFIAISYTIIDSGFSQALIREQEISQEDYSTAFFFNLFISIILVIILFVSANKISNFYKEPRLVPLMKIMSAILIINALSLTQRTMLVKNVDFKTQTIVTGISGIIAGIAAIIMAYLGYGVWSIAANQIVMSTCQTFLLWVYNRWIPSLMFSKDSFNRLFGFGSKLLISAVINTIYGNLYALLIGRFYSTAELGYYTNAVRPRDIIMTSATSAIERVTYPILADILDDDSKLKESYRTTIKMTIFVFFPIMLGLAAVAKSLFIVLFGAKWLPSVLYFKLLCLAGILYPLNALNLNILKVKGRSDLFLKLEVYKKVILTAAILFFFRWGILGLLWASILCNTLGYGLNVYYSGGLIAYSVKEQIIDIIPSLTTAALMGFAVYFSAFLMPQIHFVRLALQMITGIATYIAIGKLFKIRELELVIELGKHYLKRN